MTEKVMKGIEKPEDLEQLDMARLVVDMFHRIMVHYTLWFTEVEHQFGVQRALEIMKTARKNSYNIQMDRFAKVFGFEMKDGVPKALLDMPTGLPMTVSGFSPWSLCGICTTPSAVTTPAGPAFLPLRLGPSRNFWGFRNRRDWKD